MHLVCARPAGELDWLTAHRPELATFAITHGLTTPRIAAAADG